MPNNRLYRLFCDSLSAKIHSKKNDIEVDATLRTDAMETMIKNERSYWIRMYLPLVEQGVGPNNWIVLCISFSSVRCHGCIFVEPREVSYSRGNEEV
jgi:hypothetical protein